MEKGSIEDKLLKSSESRYEILRLELLAALYEKEYKAAGKLLREATKMAASQNYLTENDLKRLRQIRLVFKRFKTVFPKDILPEIVSCMDELSHRLAQEAKTTHPSLGFAEWQKKEVLPSHLEARVFQTTMTLQLTTGCSHFCRRCNEWALPGVRRHFSFEAVQTMLTQIASLNNDEISLYGASDPLDWQDGDKNIIDIVQMADRLPLKYSLLTKVPKSKSSLLKHLKKSDANISISVTTKNKSRIEKFETSQELKLTKQHDTNDLMIPAGLDEDFVSVKPSITDGYGSEITPDGAFIIIPAFTSSLYPFGHKKFRVNSQTRFFPLKKTGRYALLVDYFKPLSGYAPNGTQQQLTNLLDVQVESIILDSGDDELTPPGMRSTKEYLQIFDEDARLRRKKMTLSVIRRLKKEHLRNTTYMELSLNEKLYYRKKIRRHLDLCRTDVCRKMRLATLSFILESVSGYVNRNPLKVKILRRLLAEEAKNNQTLFSELKHLADVRVMASGSSIEIFEIFRYFILSLIGAWNFEASGKQTLDIISRFIKTYPSEYDPLTDLFVLSDHPA